MDDQAQQHRGIRLYEYVGAALLAGLLGTGIYTAVRWETHQRQESSWEMVYMTSGGVTSTIDMLVQDVSNQVLADCGHQPRGQERCFNASLDKRVDETLSLIGPDHRRDLRAYVVDNLQDNYGVAVGPHSANALSP